MLEQGYICLTKDTLPWPQTHLLDPMTHPTNIGVLLLICNRNEKVSARYTIYCCISLHLFHTSTYNLHYIEGLDHTHMWLTTNTPAWPQTHCLTTNTFARPKTIFIECKHICLTTNMILLVKTLWGLRKNLAPRGSSVPNTQLKRRRPTASDSKRIAIEKCLTLCLLGFF